jgi:glutamate/tyrosine decarboxylase-like PLP-dependent enzyme
VWGQVGEDLRGFLADLPGLPVLPTLPNEEIHRRVAGRLDQEPARPLAEVIAEVSGLLRGGLVQATSPRYFGLFNPSVHEAGIVADALVAAYNPQLAVRSHAPAAAELEEEALRFLAGVLGLPPDPLHANFTTGGAEANHTAVLAALADRFPEGGTGGLRALRTTPRIYLSSESHHSFVKIARMTGLGTDSLRSVPTNDGLAMDADALEQLVTEDLARGEVPLLVVATAGTTGSGAVDPLPQIARVAARHGAWFHVDAAWGGAAAFSPRLRPVLAAIERADSLTWDAHKWLSVPMAAGMFFCRRPEAVRRAFGVATSYMPSSSVGEVRDGYATTMQWSRRAIGIKVYMTLAVLGRGGYARLIEHQAEMGARLRGLLSEAGWKVVNRTSLPVVCFTHPQIVEGEGSTKEILDAVHRRGRVWISEVALGGAGRALRACITSYRTGEEDLRCLIEEIENARTAHRTRRKG